MLIARPFCNVRLHCLWHVVVVVLMCGSGCHSTQQHRLNADAESYRLVEQKTQHPRWWTPTFSIDPPPESRNHDPFDPECGPLPPDDPAAHEIMHHPGRQRGSHHWEHHGMAADIENSAWREFLELDDDQTLHLTPERAVQIGLLNSREYQFELENLYLNALALTLERFEYDLQWFGRNSTIYDWIGSRLGGQSATTESSFLSTSSDLGFTRTLPAGGQLLVDFANTFVWQFAGSDTGTTLSTATVSMVQPLLRGAFRDVQLESLTQSERNVLYAARDYARFRKQFYFDLVSGDDGYLSLLLQLQAIRNLEANLEALSQNLRAHEALAQAGIVSLIQVDQVFQNYQSGRLRLIRARNDLQNSLDRFKLRLGLPPELEVRLDDSLLQPFELNSAEIVQLQIEIDELLAAYRQRDEAPPVEELEQGFGKLQVLHEEVVAQSSVVMTEWRDWRDAHDPAVGEESREADSQRTLKSRLTDLEVDLERAKAALEQAARTVADAEPDDSWHALQRMAREVSSFVGDLFVIQSQIRASVIEIDPEAPVDDAVDYALNNRLDLMNRRAEVVDQWRKSHVAADALQADLDVFAEGVLGTNPTSGNPVRFSSDDSRFQVGLRFDGPLNRQQERNIYRAQLVNYQRARRRFIDSRDRVVQAVRRDLRGLDADRLNFEIARQSLIVAARQVELAQIELLAPRQEGDSSTTQDALNALNSLLDAKNALIAVWVSYETNRLRLLLDTESLQLDERGLPQYGDFSEADDLELIAPGTPVVTPDEP